MAPTFETLIVDTAAFINKVPLWEISKKLITVKEVVYEIKDRNTQSYVDAYPVPIEYEVPNQKSIQFIIDFTKKTGDYAVLSAADIKVLALAYQTEIETHGSEHLRLEPMKRIVNTQVSVPLNTLDSVSEENEDKDIEETEKMETNIESNNTNPTNTECENKDDEGGEWSTYKSKRKHRPVFYDDDGNVSVTSRTSRATSCKEHYGVKGDLPPGWYLPSEKNMDQDLMGEDEDESEDSSDECWITPDNIGNIEKGLPLNYDPAQDDLPDYENPEYEDSTVGCITGDFSMQNVLHHIGLRVIGIDGKVIKQTKTYTLRCTVCYKVCNDMNKIFCPKCGYRTLRRVSITLNPDGTQNIWISRRRLNTRGLRFNLPKPRGGKHAVMPLLSADQKFPQQKAKKMKSVDVFSAGYTARNSPFATNDVYSKAAALGLNRSSGHLDNPQTRHAKIWKKKHKRTYK